MPRKPKPIGAAEANTYGLPRGEPIRKSLRTIFRDQRNQMLAILDPTLAKKDDQSVLPLPDHWPDFRLGNLAMSERMTPLLSVYWEQSGRAFRSRNDLDPDKWEVSDPHLQRMIETAALNFCEETNKTTRLTLDDALNKTRTELIAGTVTKGESIPQLTKRVNEIFDSAEKWRARRIAQTEASRAVHAAQEQSAIESGVVAGWEWLASSDACPLCLMVADKCNKIRLGEAFAVVGTNPVYSTIKFPPIHPHDNCSVLEVLKPEFGGPENPEWGQTLIQPKPDEPKPTEPEKPKPEEKPKPAEPKPVEPKPEEAPKPVEKPDEPKPVEPEKPKPDLTTMPIGDAIKAYTAGDDKIKQLIEMEPILATHKAALDDLANIREDARIAANKLKWFKDTQASEVLIREAQERHNQLKKDIKKAETALAKLPDPGQAMLGIIRPKGPILKIDSSAETHSVNPKAIAKAEKFLSQVIANKTGYTDDVLFTKYKRSDLPKGRAYCGGKTIGLNGQSQSQTVVHEWGHRLENEVKGVQSRANEFIDYRLNGEKPTQLAKLFPGHKFNEDEYGAKDEFNKAFGDGSEPWYIGKKYSHGSTEVISMGLEKLYSDPVGFARKDPEYCKLILGILSGELRP